MNARQRRREWWKRQSPERRVVLRRRHAGHKPIETGFLHHFNHELACPACGTDSSVGCIAEAR